MADGIDGCEFGRKLKERLEMEIVAIEKEFLNTKNQFVDKVDAIKTQFTDKANFIRGQFWAILLAIIVGFISNIGLVVYLVDRAR